MSAGDQRSVYVDQRVYELLEKQLQQGQELLQKVQDKFHQQGQKPLILASRRLLMH